LDRAGYFVIIPDIKKNVIIAEHYDYENKLLQIIEGEDAPSLYSTVMKTLGYRIEPRRIFRERVRKSGNEFKAWI